MFEGSAHYTAETNFRFVLILAITILTVKSNSLIHKKRHEKTFTVLKV